MAIATPTYYKGTIEVLPAGERRFLVKSGDGTGHSYAMDRALGKLVRRVGALIEHTGHGATVYLQLPVVSKATGADCSTLTAQNIADFIAKS